MIGIAGAQEIVSAVDSAAKDSKHVPCIAFGGLDPSDIRLVYWECETYGGCLDGSAIGEAIIGADSPQDATKRLSSMLFEDPPSERVVLLSSPMMFPTIQDMLTQVVDVAQIVAHKNPISHIMTNGAAANFIANVVMATGARPIMSKSKEEVGELANLSSDLVLNIADITPDDLTTIIAGVKAYNTVGAPVILNVTGAATTKTRSKIASELLHNGYIDMIQGSTSDLHTLLLLDPLSESTNPPPPSAILASTLALQHRCIVLLTETTSASSPPASTHWQ